MPDSSSSPLTGSIRQIALTVADVERATTFYGDALGLPHLFTEAGIAFFDCDGVRLLLSEPEGDVGGASSILYFSTEDIGKAHATLADQGVRFEGAPHLVHRDEHHELWMAFFEDGEGNVHAIVEEVPAASA